MEKCPKKWQKECPLEEHYLVRHHTAYPGSKYTTPLEQEYRKLPSNKIEMCRFVEMELHRVNPNGPPKPTIEVMEYCVEQERLHRELEGRRP